MGHLVAHLVRRGLEMTKEQYLERQANLYANSDYHMPKWAVALVVVTASVFVLLLASLSYTIGHVVLTLAAVETPTSTSYVKLDQNAGHSDAPLEKEALLKDSIDLELTAVPLPSKPITRKIRSTVKHLTAIGGFRSRWRGMKYGLVYMFLLGFFSNILRHVFPRFPASRAVIFTLVSVVFVRVHAAWTHATIAMPSQKRVRDRLLPRRLCWRQLAIPTIALMTVPKFLHRLLACSLMGLNRLAELKNLPIWVNISGTLALVAAAVCVDIFIALPLLATLTRIETALLPEDDDTVVPVDRTFGGLLNADSLIAGASCAFGTFKKAVGSIDGEARRRMAKVYLKLFLIVTAVCFTAFNAVLLELWLVMGDKLAILLVSVNAKLQQEQLHLHHH